MSDYNPFHEEMKNGERTDAMNNEDNIRVIPITLSEYNKLGKVQFRPNMNIEGDIVNGIAREWLTKAMQDYCAKNREYAIAYNETDHFEAHEWDAFVEMHNASTFFIHAYTYGNLIRIEWRPNGECDAETIIINALDDPENAIIMHSIDSQSFLSTFI